MSALRTLKTLFSKTQWNYWQKLLDWAFSEFWKLTTDLKQSGKLLVNGWISIKKIWITVRTVKFVCLTLLYSHHAPPQLCNNHENQEPVIMVKSSSHWKDRIGLELLPSSISIELLLSDLSNGSLGASHSEHYLYETWLRAHPLTVNSHFLSRNVFLLFV